MGQDQHDIEEFARMERLCLELAAGESALPLEQAGLLTIASNYRAAILDAKNRQSICKHGAHTALFLLADSSC